VQPLSVASKKDFLIWKATLASDGTDE
jgi:hypothetical protein